MANANNSRKLLSRKLLPQRRPRKLQNRRPLQTIGVASCRLTAAGTLVAATDAVGNVRVWKAVDGAPVDLLPAVADFPAITATRVSGDLLLMTDAQGRLATRSTTPGWALRTVLGPAADPAAPSVFTDRVLSLAFSPDGTLLAAGGGEASRSGQVTIWDVRENKLIHELKDAHSDTVMVWSFRPMESFSRRLLPISLRRSLMWALANTSNPTKAIRTTSWMFLEG